MFSLRNNKLCCQNARKVPFYNLLNEIAKALFDTVTNFVSHNDLNKGQCKKQKVVWENVPIKYFENRNATKRKYFWKQIVKERVGRCFSAQGNTCFRASSAKLSNEISMFVLVTVVYVYSIL